jgi:hypothetical protein
MAVATVISIVVIRGSHPAEAPPFGPVPSRGVGSRSASRSDRREYGGGWPDGGHRDDFRWG